MDKEINNGKRKKRKKNKILKFLLKFILVVIIVLVIAIGVVTGYVYSKLGRLDFKANELQNIEINDGVSNIGYTNIALFGIDARNNEYNGDSGSDSILIVSIDNTTKQVRLVSVYRDSYLSSDGKKFYKITDFYRKYGSEKTVNLLNKNLDLDISEYVTINFAVVVDVVNLVNGIEMDITKDDIKYINGYIDENIAVTGINSKHITTPGTYTLDGIQALAYARIRYIGSDIDRANRQRVVLMKTFEKIKKTNIIQINNIVDKVLPKVQTTLSSNEILKLASGVTKYNISESIGFPYEWADYQPNGIYYLSPRNLEKNVIRLHKELFNEEDYKVSDELKKISNTLINKTGIK